MTVLINNWIYNFKLEMSTLNKSISVIVSIKRILIKICTIVFFIVNIWVKIA